MKRISMFAVSFVLAAFLLCGSLCASALSFNGATSASGDGSSTTSSNGGYAVPAMLTSNSNRAVGYRFSVIDKNGNVMKSAYDLFRYKTRTTYNINYAGYYKFNSKYPKTYLKANYSGLSVTTSDIGINCTHDSDWGLDLPELTTGLRSWSTDARIGTVLSMVWGISISTLESKHWAVLVEPIFPVKLQSVYHSLTVTEIAVYGASKFGLSSDGNASSNANSFGFIATYTNRHLPNSLRLESAAAGMTAAAESSSRMTFNNIITKGYGCAILYGSYLNLPDQYYLDVNGLLDGTNSSTVSGYGTFDVYINGSRVANDVDDYNQKINAGSTYEIKDIRAASGHTYNGLASGSNAISGTVKSALNVRLNFTTNTYAFDITGFFDNEFSDDLRLLGTCDVYINGKKVADDVKDYTTPVKYGSTYTVTDIKALDGMEYSGYLTDELKEMRNPKSGQLGSVGSALSGPVAGFVHDRLKREKTADIVIIAPNAPYKEGTQVISSCWVVNPSGYDFVPDDDLVVTLTVKKSGGAQIFKKTKSVVVPKRDKNICYFKWTVPEGLGGSKVNVKFTVLYGTNWYFEDVGEFDTVPYERFTTPDTQFEKSAPENFSVSAPASREFLYGEWWEYFYENNAFIKKDFSVGADVQTRETVITEQDINAFKSGYCFGIQATDEVWIISGYDSITGDMYTDVQSETAGFPEFGYRLGEGFCKTLIKGENGFEFADSDYGKKHFVPLYYPDGIYRISIIKSDLWTPAGMLSSRSLCRQLKIVGSLYDDWFVTHK